MVDIFSDYTQKINPSGREGRLDCMSNFFLDSFTNAPEYEQVKLYLDDTVNSNLFDTWIYSDTSYKQDIPKKTMLFSPLMQDNQSLIFRGNYVRPQRQQGLWMIVNYDKQYLEKIKCEIQLCTQVLKAYDQYKVLQSVPCIMSDVYSGTSVDFDQAINIPSGNPYVLIPRNEYTSTIKINDRFIFGGQAYKVSAVRNFVNNEIGVYQLNTLIKLDMYKDSIAEGDDLANGIPVSNLSYTISLDATTINQTVGYTTQLNATVKRNNEIYSTPITWSSSNPLIATVDNNGNVNLIANGNCLISAKMTDNNSVAANCNVTVQAVPTNIREVRITPNVTEILQGKTVQYVCELYVNNILTPSTFTFVGSGAPNANYVLTTIDGNHFSVMNKLKSTMPLVVTVSNGVDSKTQNIILKGAF